MHAEIFAHTNTHAYTHTYTHVYGHIHIHIRGQVAGGAGRVPQCVAMYTCMQAYRRTRGNGTQLTDSSDLTALAHAPPLNVSLQAPTAGAAARGRAGPGGGWRMCFRGGGAGCPWTCPRSPGWTRPCRKTRPDGNELAHVHDTAQKRATSACTHIFV